MASMSNKDKDMYKIPLAGWILMGMLLLLAMWACAPLWGGE